MVKISLERVDIQEEVVVEALLDSEATELVMSSEFARKQRFKLKKIERPICHKLHSACISTTSGLIFTN